MMSEHANLAHLADTAQRLCEVIAAENDALARHRLTEATALQHAKTTLARLYADHMQALGQNPTIIESIDATARQHLLGVAARIKALSEANARLLKAALEANQRLVKAVVETARQQTAAAAPYGKNGVLRPGRSGGHTSLAFNRTL